MSSPILYHYPQSPFAEKIRLILGFKQLDWCSVKVPMIMPKPDLTMLTGGYRRVPVLQIGADIYCDTSLICDVLERLSPQPTLYPEASKGVARVIAQWADTTLFQAAMAYNFQPEGAKFIFPDSEQLKHFAADRAAMRNNASRLPPGDATSAYRSYLRKIAHMLERQPWLLGDQPCVADFSVYHSLWFTRHQVPVLAGILDTVPIVLEWMDRLAAIGHGNMSVLTTDQAFEITHQAQPVALNHEIHQDDHHIALGTQVTITAESFGLEATEGELIAATRTRYILRREREKTGVTHVHFPRVGFILKKRDA